MARSPAHPAAGPPHAAAAGSPPGLPALPQPAAPQSIVHKMLHACDASHAGQAAASPATAADRPSGQPDLRPPACAMQAEPASAADERQGKRARADEPLAGHGTAGAAQQGTLAPEEAPWQPVTLTWRVPAGLGPVGLPPQRRRRSTAPVHAVAEDRLRQPAAAEAHPAVCPPAQLPKPTTGKRSARQQEQPAEHAQQQEQWEAQTAGRKRRAEAQPSDSSDSREARVGGDAPPAGFPAHQQVPLARDDWEADSKPEPRWALAPLARKRQRRVPVFPVLEYIMPQWVGQPRQARQARRARRVNRMPLQPQLEMKQEPPQQPQWEIKQEPPPQQHQWEVKQEPPPQQHQWEVKQELPQQQQQWQVKQEPEQAQEGGEQHEPQQAQQAQQAWWPQQAQHAHRGEHPESVLAGLLQFAVRQGGVTEDAGEEIVDTFIGLLPAPHQEVGSACLMLACPLTGATLHATSLFSTRFARGSC